MTKYASIEDQKLWGKFVELSEAIETSNSLCDEVSDAIDRVIEIVNAEAVDPAVVIALLNNANDIVGSAQRTLGKAQRALST